MPRLVELIKKEIEGNTVFTRSYRIYTPYISPHDVIVIEWEYENLQELQAAWGAWRAKPDTSEFWEKWRELTDGGGKREIWELAAQR
jgi:hypothetical protein